MTAAPKVTFDAQAADFDRRAGLPAGAARRIAAAVMELAPAGRGVLLDLGAGTGQIGEHLSRGARGTGYVGLDLSGPMLDVFRRMGALGFLGVRYPEDALQQVADSGLRYRGWLANFDVPAAFHRHRFTVHVPRRFYRTGLPGIPTIRVFEALACGIPLISAPWFDCERLFSPGRDFLMAKDPEGMLEAMQAVTHDEALARELAQAGRSTIERRHSCAHRVDELLEICHELQQVPAEAVS